MFTVKLILTRHGETHENRSRTVQGQTFGELNAFGKA
ncbi:histidine phosphatase family protein, partial [Candidatus Woesearchaeota archaeon]|nr:histidine phosphatase family protein [Candidatus Woesearchaeota archaeon]